MNEGPVLAEGASQDAAPIELTVVIVTRNEEARIEACVRSTLEAVAEAIRAGVIREAETILVDSASTDRTIEIARRFPIRIVSLESTWPLSCGAGCFVGVHHARGSLTAIINGDMTVDRRWFVEAIPRLEPALAGLCGVAKENLGRRTAVERLLFGNRTAGLTEGMLPEDIANYPGGYSTGTLLLRTAAARRVGSFNPFFRAAEDMDLRLRLLRAGWTVKNVPVLQGVHFWVEEDNAVDSRTYLATLHRNGIGLGQMARYHFRSDAWLSRRAAQPILGVRTLLNVLNTFAFTLVLLLNIVALLTGNPRAMIPAVLVDAAVLGGILRRASKAGIPVSDVIFSHVWEPLAVPVVRIVGFVRGFLKSPLGPADYPSEATAAVPRG